MAIPPSPNRRNESIRQRLRNKLPLKLAFVIALQFLRQRNGHESDGDGGQQNTI